MKTKFTSLAITALVLAALLPACSPEAKETKVNTETTAAPEPPGAGQSGVIDDVSQKDVVKVAAGSPDHTTLVAAVKAGELVDALSNAGPFTVFAPTNNAFNALPAGTVDDLLKPENKDKLVDILQYHVTVSALDKEHLKDGMTLGEVNGGNVKITVKNGETYVNDAKIIGSVRASNGVVHVIDKVLLPK